MVGDPGKVKVMAPEVVFIKYPAPAAPLTGESELVLTACQEVPPDTSANDNCPTPVVPEPDTEATFKNLSAVTFPVGNFNVLINPYDNKILYGYK